MLKITKIIRTNRNYRTVSGLICRDRSGVSFIPPPRRAEDISALTPDILSELVGLAAESGDFDCVVIDAFFVFGGCGERAVRISDAVYAVCALHTVLSYVSFIQLFSGVYVRTLFLANALFVGYLLFRQEPTLCEWRQKIINQMT